MTWKILLVVGGLLTALPAAAQLTQERATVSAGGGTLTSPHYIVTGTLGQASPVGVISSETLTIHAGFWHGGAAPMAFTLTIKKRGTGSGVVTGPGIDCGADCAERYAVGATLDLAAAPDPCSRFVRWEDAAGQPLISPLTISANLTVAAVFEACCPAPVTPLSPADGAANQPLDATLTWQAADGANSYDVSLGANSPPPELANVMNMNYHSEPLAGNVTYFWRIDARNSCGAVKGPEWSFTTTGDTLAPTVTLDLDYRNIYLGQAVTIYTTAEDNGNVAEFHLTADATELATMPGTQRYTPSVAGTTVLTASAKDNAGNVKSATKTLLVSELPQSATKALRFYEGLNPATGSVERDQTVLIFTPEMRENMSEISFDPELEQGLRFPEGVSWYFTFRNRSVVVVPTAGRQIALFINRAFESLSVAEVVSATYEECPEGRALGKNDTVVIRRKSRRLKGGFSYVKIGGVQSDLPAMTVELTYQQLIAP